MHTSLKHLKSRGFTIVELLIVIVIIGILATLGLISYNGVQQGARDKSILSDLDAVAGEVTRYGTAHQGTYGSAIAWYSPSGANANIKFTPTSGDIIDVVTSTTEYCIRGYNVKSNHQSISNALTASSSSNACTMLFASVAAGGTGTTATDFWTLDGDTTDSSGAGNFGIISGATLTTGANNLANGAYAFSGSSQLIQFPTVYSPTTGTISLWFKSSSSQPSSLGSWYILSIPQAADNSRIYINTVATGDSVSARLGSGTTIGTATINTSSWYNLVVTWSGTTAKFYVNGSDVTTTSTFNGLTSAGTIMYAGCLNNAGTECVKGNIDDVRVYSKSLSAADVTSIYSAGAK
jgi:prepilin-type N-terminal cleavage/methylation domain-containing protein